MKGGVELGEYMLERWLMCGAVVVWHVAWAAARGGGDHPICLRPEIMALLLRLGREVWVHVEEVVHLGVLEPIGRQEAVAVDLGGHGKVGVRR